MTKEQNIPPATQIHRKRITIRGALLAELKIHTGLTVYLLTHTFQAQTCNQHHEVNHPHTILSCPNSTPTSKDTQAARKQTAITKWQSKQPSCVNLRKGFEANRLRFPPEANVTLTAFKPSALWPFLLLSPKHKDLTEPASRERTAPRRGVTCATRVLIVPNHETKSFPCRVSFTSELQELQDADRQCFWKNI